MINQVLSLFIAFLGYSLLNIGQAGQKIGLAAAKTRKLGGWSLWVGATIATSVSVFIVLYAVSLGRVSLVGAMAGSGLASLALFTRFVMKEEQSRRELIGVVLILASAVLIGFFSRETEETGIMMNRLYIFFAAGNIAYLIIFFIFIKLKRRSGVVIGAYSGLLAGFSTLFQKVSLSDLGKALTFEWTAAARAAAEAGEAGLFRSAIAELGNVYSIVWIACSVVSMIVLQFSYSRDKAIRIIPAFSANFIATPVIGGVLGFGDTLHLFQWIGVAGILYGTFLITRERQKKAVVSAPDRGD